MWLRLTHNQALDARLDKVFLALSIGSWERSQPLSL